MSGVPGRTPIGAMNAFTLLGYDNSGTSKVVPATVTLTPSNGAQVVNLQNLGGGNQLGAIVTVYVDNSNGPVPVTIVYPDTGMQTIVPAYSQGFWPALTAGLVMTVAAPLIAVVSDTITVNIQAANFAIPQAAYGPFYPNSNAGVPQSVGNPSGWNAESTNVPSYNGENLIFNSLTVNNLSFAGNTAVNSTGLNGQGWEVSQLQLTSSEFIIPPTVSGTPMLVTVSIPDGGTTTALIPLDWRVAPIGAQTVYNVPLYGGWTSATFSSLASGNNESTVFAAAVGFGFYVDMVQVTAVGWSSAYSVELIDAGNSYNLWTGSFGNGNTQFSSDVGYVAYERDQPLTLNVNCASAATGTLTVSVRGQLLTASQNG
jgi:hypothetical protein